ncbi:acyl carrier protein [Amycolatopsis sp. NPDC049868]|uniref:acyl carrier protein n=1 Tax=Amycolatopsis sp. NPDC049868 TaxID=3363934 RepID=UPI0037B155CB
MRDRLSELLAERFGVPPEEIHDEVTLTELDLDSLALVEFGLAIEQVFGIKVAEDDMSTSDTVDDVLRMLESKGCPA